MTDKEANFDHADIPTAPSPAANAIPQSKKTSIIFSGEMRPFWIFVFSSLLLVAVDFLYLDLAWAVASAIILFALALLLYSGILRIIKKAELSRAVSERLEGIISTIPDGVIVYDRDFRVTIFNPAAEGIFSVRRDEIVGQTIGPNRAQDPKLRLLAQTIFPSLAPLAVKRSEPGAIPQVVDISLSDPALELRVATSPVLAGNEAAGFIKVIIDRTREVEIYRSKSEFITVAAHQLQNPITTIYWALDILRKDASLSEESKEVVREGFVSSQNLSKIVNDLLDVSKIEEGKFGYNFQDVNITSFFGEIMKNAAPAAKSAGVNLYFDPGKETTLTINIDPAKLAMAVSNLIDNGIRYNLKNGSVTVSLDRLPDKPFVKIAIKDTGVGIPPEGMDKLFKKFFRAENAVKVQTEGTGLGLYIAKNIVKRHGGSIWAESVLGRGTTFYFTLPTDPKYIPHKEAPYEE